MNAHARRGDVTFPSQHTRTQAKTKNKRMQPRVHVCSALPDASPPCSAHANYRGAHSTDRLCRTHTTCGVVYRLACTRTSLCECGCMSLRRCLRHFRDVLAPREARRDGCRFQRRLGLSSFFIASQGRAGYSGVSRHPCGDPHTGCFISLYRFLSLSLSPSRLSHGFIFFLSLHPSTRSVHKGCVYHSNRAFHQRSLLRPLLHPNLPFPFAARASLPS